MARSAAAGQAMCFLPFPAAQPTHSPVLLFSLRHSPHTVLCFLPFPAAQPTESPVPIVRQVRQVRQVRLVRLVRHSLPAVSALRKVLCQPAVPPSAPVYATPRQAMCCEISGAHGSHCTLCRLPSEAFGEGGSVQVRTSPYKSVFPCPHPVHCTMCSASQ